MIDILYIGRAASKDKFRSSKTVSSFPGLPRFYLLFAFTIVGDQRKSEKAWKHSSRELDVGEEGPIYNMCVINLKVSFLPIKTSSSITLKSGLQNCGRAFEWII